MREEAIRVADRLEGTLRIPDAEPRGVVVVAHPLPTHGGTMRNPLRAASLTAQEVPPVPDGTFIVAADHDQFGTGEELGRAFPRARIAVVNGVDHFFVGKRDEVGRLVADELARALASAVP